MKRKTSEKVAYAAAIVLVTAAAVGAVFSKDDLEVTFFMVSAVIAGLICFDTSMDRHAKSFVPWLLLSMAPAAKTVPSVWYVLNSENGLSEERWDHIGSLLFGGFVFAAAWTLSRPSKLLGRATAAFDAVVVLGVAVTSGVAGASVAYLYDPGFGSVTAARTLESVTWAAVGGLLAAVVLAAARAPKPTAPLVGALTASAATAGMLAYTVSGRDLDRGWWAILFAAFAWSASAFGLASLGQRESRIRQSHAAPWLAGLAGAVAAAAAISARGDRTAWSSGWILLGVVSLGLFALALLWPSPDPYVDLGDEVDIDEAIAQARAKESALGSLRAATAASAVRADPNVATTSGAADFGGVLAGVAGSVSATPADIVASQSAASQPVVAATPEPVPATPKPEPVLAAPLPVAADPVAPDPLVVREPAATAVPAASAQPAAMVAASTSPAHAAEARPVAATPAARPAGRASVPRAPYVPAAHHMDPSTGLLSAAGLQEMIVRGFDTPPQAGYLTVMMLTIRDLDDIEAAHGRLSAAAVTREVAQRLQRLLPDGTGARFARSAYAVVFFDLDGEPADTVHRLAVALKRMRAPVADSGSASEIDVVAGMAQCYEGEDAASFIRRGNHGLARAVKSPEPTFVAMP